MSKLIIHGKSLCLKCCRLSFTCIDPGIMLSKHAWNAIIKIFLHSIPTVYQKHPLGINVEMLNCVSADGKRNVCDSEGQTTWRYTACDWFRPQSEGVNAGGLGPLGPGMSCGSQFTATTHSWIPHNG